MKLLHSNQPYFEGGKSIFLAGPTPRSLDTKSWRPEAVEILEKYDFDGTVLIPEPFTDYMHQVTWERHGLSKASAIVVWVPRCMKTMPALTSNIEFGYWLAKTPEKLVYGRPENAPHTDYMDWLYNLDTGKTHHKTLEKTLMAAMITAEIYANLGN